MVPIEWEAGRFHNVIDLPEEYEVRDLHDRESTSPQNLNTILASMMRIGLEFTIPTYFRGTRRCTSA